MTLAHLIAGAVVAAVLLATPAEAAEPPAAPKAVHLVTLGTGGGPSDRLKRAHSSNAVIVGDDIYIVDTGDGILRQLAGAGLPVERIRAIFITHHHFDHNAGLGPLLTRRWLFGMVGSYEPIPVIGPPMTREMVAGLAKAYRPIELAPITIGGPPTPPIASTVDARDLPPELNEPAIVYEDENLRVSAVLNNHYHFDPGSEAARLSRSYALRFDTPSRSIAFTGDTGPSARVEALARGADVLVSEVIDIERIAESLRSANDDPARKKFIDSLIEHLRLDHVTPSQVGEMAARAGVAMVVLSHIVPGWDEETDMSVYTRGIDEHYKGPVHVANDLDRF